MWSNDHIFIHNVFQILWYLIFELEFYKYKLKILMSSQSIRARADFTGN
jgi:hypothetical protein